MNAPADIARVVDRFSVVAGQFCAVVDSASSMERNDFLLRIYQKLPKLIDEAISLPQVEPSDSDNQVEGTGSAPSSRKPSTNDQEWPQPYNLLKEKLGDWDSYWQVFDPTEDSEAIFGSLADDIADIYRDLQEGLVLCNTHLVPPEDIIWEWRFSFETHWGKHAMDALLAIHFRLQNAVS